MSVVVQCPNPDCGATAQVSEDRLGRFARCKRCGLTFPLTPSTGPSPGAAGGGSGLMPSAVVGRYQIRQRLGAGSYGTVYRAYDPQLDREVALKVLRPEALASPAAVERFQREARAAARMLHPHIVPVYDTGRDGARQFIASAFISGRPLDAIVPERGLEPGRAVRLTLQLAEALAYAHQQGVLHRDVKPQNMLVDDGDRLYLTDFGLAGWMSEQQSRLTRVGSVMGTPAFMAPEQARGDTRHAGPAADQYSAGVVLYRLLTGRLPFEGRQEVVLYHILQTPPPAPSVHRPDLDPPLAEICLKAMAKKPEERFADCAAFGAALQAWLAASATGPASAVGRPQASAPESAPPVGRPPAPPHDTQGALNWSEETTAPPPVRRAATRRAAAARTARADRRRPAGEGRRATVFWILGAAAGGIAAAVLVAAVLLLLVFFPRAAKPGPAAVAAADAGLPNAAEPKQPPRELLADFQECQKQMLADKWKPYIELTGPVRFSAWKAAAEDFPEGEWLLGCCYELGAGATRDKAEALRWYRKAADHGLAEAQSALGTCYLNGILGVSKDDAEAVRLYRLAADQGNPLAEYRLGDCYANGRGVAKDDAKAFEFYRKAADQGHVVSQLHAGECYFQGVGVNGDPTAAVDMFRKAAEQGNAEAQFKLGLCCQLGWGATRDKKGEADEWFRKAVESFRKTAGEGDAESQYALGMCYENGYGVVKSVPQALQWYRKAADQGNALAQQAVKRLTARDDAPKAPPAPAPSPTPAPGGAVAASSAQLVGTWKYSGTEFGQQVQILWQMRADGSATYLITSNLGTVVNSSTWQYSGGVMYETFQNGAPGRARLDFLDANRFMLTILDNGAPAYTGLKRVYVRQ